MMRKVYAPPSVREDPPEVFQSRRSLLRWYLAGEADKLPALGLLLREAEKRGFPHIVSLGAGPCVLEGLLAQALPEGVRVTATERDGELLAKAARHFPEVTAIRHDFVRDGLEEVMGRAGPPPRLAVFFGSAYVMDDGEYAGLLSRLKGAGVQCVVDFYAGYLDWRDCLGVFSRLRTSSFLRGVMGRPPLGQAHGFSRSRGELREIYLRAGWKPVLETDCGAYKYAAVLESI